MMNVIDKYKGWEVDLIRKDVHKYTLPYAICMINLEYDFNFGTLVRNANAFGARDVYYMSDKRKWDRRSAVGVQNYTNVTQLKSYEEIINRTKNRLVAAAFDENGKWSEFRNYKNLVAIENNPDYPGVDLSEFEWPENPIIVFGSENQGINPGFLAQCDAIVSIPMMGSVRSLNVGTASGIVLHDYMVKCESI